MMRVGAARFTADDGGGSCSITFEIIRMSKIFTLQVFVPSEGLEGWEQRWCLQLGQKPEYKDKYKTPLLLFLGREEPIYCIREKKKPWKLWNN
jgi:hypothetical protein